MRYLEQSISVACDDGHFWTVPGVVFEGYPLGYHYDLTYPDLLVVTQLETGKKIPGALALEEEQIQAILELLLMRYPWTVKHIATSPARHLENLVAQAMSETGVLQYI